MLSFTFNICNYYIKLLFMCNYYRCQIQKLVAITIINIIEKPFINIYNNLNPCLLYVLTTDVDIGNCLPIFVCLFINYLSVCYW